MVDNSENILVEFDYNNITIVDPNKVIDAQGKVKDRNVKQEDLVMYANLECKVLPRTKLALGVASNDQVRTISVAAINFLNPGNKGVLDNSYTDEITGKDVLAGTGVNQPKSEKILNPKKSDDYYIRQTILSNGKPGSVDNGLLGITNIQIRQGLDFLPTITMELEDIKGRAMFEAGNNSPYAAFFNLPYPLFYLTIKGYYGKAVKLALMLYSFTSRYDTSSGNFKISLTFYTYKYTVLNEVLMGYLKAIPYMYSSRVKIQPVKGGPSNFTPQENKSVELGYQKIKELYSEYKSKGLIPDDFPEITVNQLRNKLESFVKDILDKFTKENMDPLTNLDSYTKTLEEYTKAVYYTQDSSKPSWFYKYMDTEDFFVLKNGIKVYTFKKEFKDKPDSRKNAPNELQSILDKFNAELESNKTVGKGGSYTIDKKVEKSNISFTINLKTFKYNLDQGNIDFAESYRQRKKISQPSDKEIEAFEKELVNQGTFNSSDIVQKNGNKETIYNYFVFEGESIAGQPDTFITITNKIYKNLEDVRQKIQEALTNALSKLLLNKGSNGIGFIPNIRNILAVFFANGEAFLRLMDDIHGKAWEQRDNKIRKSAIQDPTIKTGSQEISENDTDPVYPWPQFIVATNGEDGHGKYEIKYPGDYTVLSKTKGYLYDVWPEVEFVEEFIKGFTTNDTENTNAEPTSNELIDVQRVSVNAIEYPVSNIVYNNKEEVKFFFEIFERLFLVSNYSRLYRSTSSTYDAGILTDVISETESTNIINSLTNQNPFIIQKLKEFGFNGQNFDIVLRHMSNDGTGQSWQNFIRGIFNTTYIKNLVNNSSFSFLNESIVVKPAGNPVSSLKNEDKLVEYIKNSDNTNTFDLLDIYPFTRLQWDKSYLANGTAISDAPTSFSTKKVLSYNTTSKVITNFLGSTGVDSIKPFTNFSTKNVVAPFSSIDFNLKTFYSERTNDIQLPTEGNLRYFDYSGQVSSNQTVSMLNTPYFVNSIQEGVQKFRNFDNHPYVSSAYLFINSLPLSTLKEKYKTYTGSESTYSVDDLDYIFATLKKFGAIHKIPYAWLLKIGSVWHRYKTYVETGNDILSESWSGFSYVKNYDPVSNSPERVYSLIIDGAQIDVVLQKNTTLGLETSTLINTGFYPKLINDFNVFYQGFEIIKENVEINGNCNILNSTMTVTSVNVTGLQVGNILTGTGILPGTTIVSQIDGNIGGTGNYTVSISQTKGSGSFVVSNSVYVGYNDSDIQDAFLSGLTIDYVPEAIINLPEGFDPNSSKRDLRVIPWSVYVNTFDKQFSYIFPSQGSFINQTLDECFSGSGINTKLVDEVSGNTAMYDGSVRLLWTAPNYGYFDTTKLVKSTPSQYLKQVFSGKSDQENFSINGKVSGYTEISEMFSIFEKSVLDSFETEFLNFSKSVYDYNSGENNVNSLPSEKSFKNFQMLFRDLMKIPAISGTTNTNKINFAQEKQLVGFTDRLNNFLNYNVVFKYGNPSNFDKRLFYTFSNLPITDPYTWENYTTVTPNALPPQTTLVNSQTSRPNVWNALKLYVGYSEIPELQYKNSGSYITDFFIDLNVAFNVDNVIQFAPIIKIYATQKLKDNTLNLNKFYGLMNDYLASVDKFRSDTITNLMIVLRTQLPNVNNSPETIINSRLNGDQTKVEHWETFKALNDKWVAGGDFKTKTLFEDVLLLDRASRNIGDKIFVDIVSLSDMLHPDRMNYKMPLYTVISTILTMNNFQIMNLPSYVNFYNVQDASKNPTPRAEGSLEFANTLFGNFMNVDYRESSPKLVCFYAGKSSEQLAIKNNVDYRFRDDAFDLTRQGDNPLFENQIDKKDWDKSNKVVGFNVDIGPQNQSIFHSFQVAQNPGLATMESLAVETQMSNLYNGTGGATQNISLYNLYKNRSYSCTIFMMGNAMIQPTMYFNLRHVPMFSGPYMIQKVNHTISPGHFETIIEGIRQPTAELPKIENYIQVLKQTLLKSIIQKVQQEKTATPASKTDVLGQNSQNYNNQDGNSKMKTDGRALCKPNEKYSNFAPLNNITQNSVNYQTVINTIRAITTNVSLQYTVFATLYIASGTKDGLSANDNNYSNITLNQFWGTDVFSDKWFTNKQYFCGTLKSDKQEMPYASFSNLEECVGMLCGRWLDKMGLITDITTPDDIAKFWILYNNSNVKKEDNVYTSYNSTELQNLKDKIKTSFEIFNPATGNVTNTQPAATTIEFSPFIEKKTFTISNKSIIESLKVTIDSSQGAWEIILARWDYTITAPCGKGDGTNQDLNAGYITTNGQEYFVNTKSLLKDFGCDKKDYKGQYKFTLDLTANPVTSSGELDTTRKQTGKFFYYNFEF